MEKFLENLREKWTEEQPTGRLLATRTAFLNYIRKHTNIIIIFPKERIFLTGKDDWKSSIRSAVFFYQDLFKQGLMEWHGKTTENHVHQISKLLNTHFLFDEVTITDKMIERAVERIMLEN